MYLKTQQRHLKVNLCGSRQCNWSARSKGSPWCADEVTEQVASIWIPNLIWLIEFAKLPTMSDISRILRETARHWTLLWRVSSEGHNCIKNKERAIISELVRWKANSCRAATLVKEMARSLNTVVWGWDLKGQVRQGLLRIENDSHCMG